MNIFDDLLHVDVIETWILKSTWGHKDDTTLDGREAIMPDGNSKIVL
ncbi:MAG: hypothetical protein KAI09_04890 [Dehalococcoidales bacterium]|nr:hypothetical protein [Dehalococcoidales bacterium]